MTQFNNNQLISISQAFFPYAERRRQAFYQGMKLVHYTSADTAYSIIDHGKVWLRRATAMNDYREIEYGKYVIDQSLSADKNKFYERFIANVFPEKKFDVRQELSDIYNNALSGTYINCLSEHDPEEDHIGRLSMWRAYGGETGVAVVIKPGAIQTEAALGVISSPVLYPREDVVHDQLQGQVESITRHINLIKQIGPEMFHNVMRSCLKIAVISIKHRGFHEEREWRIVHEPLTDDMSLIDERVYSIRGTPQIIKLLDITRITTSSGLPIALEDIISHIIIGPTHHPDIICEAFVKLLTEKGFRDPKSRVIKSNIPLRYE